MGEHGTARARLEESLSLYRALGDRRGAARARCELGVLARETAQYALACAALDEGVIAFRQLAGATAESSLFAEANDPSPLADPTGDLCSLAFALHQRGSVAQLQCELRSARLYLEAGKRLMERIGCETGPRTRGTTWDTWRTPKETMPGPDASGKKAWRSSRGAATPSA
jgi:hypothetical protein